MVFPCSTKSCKKFFACGKKAKLSGGVEESRIASQPCAISAIPPTASGHCRRLSPERKHPSPAGNHLLEEGKDKSTPLGMCVCVGRWGWWGKMFFSRCSERIVWLCRPVREASGGAQPVS